MTDSNTTDEIVSAVERLEQIEDELAGVGGMGEFRERISEVRADLVEAALDDVWAAKTDSEREADK